MSHNAPSKRPANLLSLVVVHQSDLQHLVTLLDHDSPRVVSHTINESESPDLVRRPARLGIGLVLHVQLAFGAALLLLAIQPALLLEGVLKICGVDPARLALQLAEDVVVVKPGLPV